MERNDFVALILIIFVAVVGALFAASATLFGRSETLVNVRDTDVKLIEGLLREIADRPPNTESAARIGAALDVLRNPYTHAPYIGLSVYHGDQVVATNAPPADRQLNSEDPSTQERPIGNGWKLIVKRYEHGYAWNAWHSFLSVPVRQFIDGRDVTWYSIRDKALVPFLVTLVTGLALAAAFTVVLIRSRRKIRELEQRAATSMTQLELAVTRMTEIELNVEQSRRQIEELDAQIRRHALVGEELEDQRQQAARGLELENRKLAEDLKANESLLDELSKQKDELWLAMEEKERELQENRKSVQAKTEEAQRLQAELEAKSTLAASKSDAQKKFLKKVWEVDWHDEALAEAFEMYRTGQPGSRRRLTDLLARALVELPPSNGGRWEPMKPKAPEVRHNAHADQAKVYWYEPRKHSVCVLAASGGADDHQRFDGGEVLRRRFQTMQAKLARQNH